jgi:hypothetical protein
MEWRVVSVARCRGRDGSACPPGRPFGAEARNLVRSGAQNTDGDRVFLAAFVPVKDLAVLTEVASTDQLVQATWLFKVSLRRLGPVP